MRAKKIAGLLPLAAATFLMISCGGGGKNDQSADSTVVELPRVKIETVRTRTVEQTYEFTATVEANVTNNIAPSMSVRIDRILVEVGDNVSKGQIVARMDQTGVLQSDVQLQNYKIEFERTDELYKVGGASRSEWDARKVALDVAQAAYDDLVKNTTLTSPISGVVTARNYDNGDMYSQGSPVLVVEQLAPVKLKINVSETLFKYIRNGMDVTFKLDVYGDEEFHGRVSLVYPTVDPQTRTFPVEITIPNADRRVRPGMFARVTISMGNEERVVAPDLSIVKQAGSGERYVYVYDNGTVVFKRVELGRRLGDEYEVISGVNDGEQVIVTGLNRLTNGAKVQLDTTK